MERKPPEFYRCARELHKGFMTVDEVCNLLKLRVEEWMSPETEFNYEPFIPYMSKLFKNEYGFYSWNGLHYFLYEYEYMLER